MRDELIDSLEEILVGRGLEIERRGAERKPVNPRPSLGGDHRRAIKCPAEEAQREAVK
jgi:hypothetical protein